MRKGRPSILNNSPMKIMLFHPPDLPGSSRGRPLKRNNFLYEFWMAKGPKMTPKSTPKSLKMTLRIHAEIVSKRGPKKHQKLSQNDSQNGPQNS